MQPTAPSLVVRDPAAILDRQTMRRNAGIPTITVLVGSLGVGGRTWRRWSQAAGHPVVSTTDVNIPLYDWLHAAIDQRSLPNLAFTILAQSSQQDPNELRASWRNKSPADRDHWWLQLSPTADDLLLRVLADAAHDGDSTALFTRLVSIGDKVIADLVRLDPSAKWPSLLWVARNLEHLKRIVPLVGVWAMRATGPLALAVSPNDWSVFLAETTETRTKTILREGEIVLPTFDDDAAQQQLLAAGATHEHSSQLLAQLHGDPELLASAIELLVATKKKPENEDDDNLARSKAERFLFQQLENIPELAGKFRLNAELDFRFGPKKIEIDLLCETPKIAIEIDGYYHFQDMDNYRRDRRKDWELQKRGYRVLRFLADDVLYDWEPTRDRIMDSLASTPTEKPH